MPGTKRACAVASAYARAMSVGNAGTERGYAATRRSKEAYAGPGTAHMLAGPYPELLQDFPELLRGYGLFYVLNFARLWG
eukprot:268445-Rhodomonas_salina.2